MQILPAQVLRLQLGVEGGPRIKRPKGSFGRRRGRTLGREGQFERGGEIAGVERGGGDAGVTRIDEGGGEWEGERAEEEEDGHEAGYRCTRELMGWRRG